MSIESEWEEIVDRCDAYNDRISKTQAQDIYDEDRVFKDTFAEIKKYWRTQHSKDILDNLNKSIKSFNYHKEYVYKNYDEYDNFTIFYEKETKYPD